MPFSGFIFDILLTHIVTVLAILKGACILSVIA